MKYILLAVSVFLFGESLAQGSWTATNGPYGGNVSDLERDAGGNTYALVSQALYKSTNDGSSWQKVVTVNPTSLYINDLLISNGKFYAIYWSSFYTSTDGLTWTKPATTFPFNNAQKIIKFGPDGFLAVYGTDGIFVSKDEGVTWVNALSDRVYYNGYERVVATTNGDLYAISRNASLNNFQGFEIKKLPYPGLAGTFDPANWQTKYSTAKSGTITTSTASAAVIGVATSFTTQLKVGSNIYNSTADQYIGTVLSIASNTSLTLTGTAQATLSSAAYSADPYQYSTHLLSFGSNVYLFTSNDILISQNGGATWPSIKGNITAGGFWGFGGVNTNGAVYYYNGSSSEIYSLINPTPPNPTWTITPATAFSNISTSVLGFSFISTSSFLVATNSAGVLKSTNTGATYSLATTGITGATVDQIAVANTTGKIFAAKSGGGYTSSVDGGATWTTTTLPNSGTSSKVLKLANGNILLYGNGNIFRSTDNGANFSSDNIYRGYDRQIIEAANGNLYLFYGVYANPNTTPKIAKSTDGGGTWVDLAITGLPTSFQFNYAAIDGTTNILFHGVDLTTSSVKTFKVVGTTATLLTMPYAYDFNNLFFQNNKFYASQFSTYYYTSDLGTTWTPVGFSGNKVFPIKNASYSGIAVSRPGALYISQNEGGSWSNTTLPEASSYITSIATDASGDFYASAVGSSVLKFTNELLVDPATLPPYINFNWQPLNGPYGGRTTKIQSTTDGNTLFSIVQNRLWKYTSGSGLWSLINPAVANGLVYDVEVDGTTIYALTNTNPQKIYKSTNLGVGWTALNSTGLPAGSNNIRRIEVLSNGSILAFGRTGLLGSIYKSSNAGASFTVQFTSAFNQIYGSDGTTASRKPAVNPTGGGGTVAIFGLPTEGMVVSTDFGTTWTVKSLSSVISPTGFVGSYMYDKDGNLLMQYIVDTGLPIWVTDIAKSSDNGTTWTNLNTPNVQTPTGSVYSKRIIVLGTGEYLMSIQGQYDCYRSTNGGTTWTNIGNVGDAFLWAYTQGTTSYILGISDAGILKTTDGGQTFTPFSTGIPHPFAYEITLLNNKDMVIGATRPYYSSDFGQNFTLATLKPASQYLLVGDSIIGYGSNGKLQKSKDAGKTWAEFGADDLYFDYLTKDATGAGFYGSDGQSLKYSTNLITWTDIVLSGLPADYYILSLVTDQGGAIYAVILDNVDNSTTVYKIVFGSAVNISTSIGTKNPANILYFNNKAYLYDSDGIIFKSTDGEIWTQTSAPAGTSLVVANNYLFIPGNDNSVLWLSRNDGGDWQSVGDTPPPSGLFTIFNNVVINEYDGYAYATLTNSVAKKSGNMVMPDDKTKPVAATYLPANNATNVSKTPTLTITFDEITRSVTGKKIRIFDFANQAVPVETIDMSTAVQSYKSWSVSPTALAYNKTYFVVMDAGAVTDIFGNAYTGIASFSTWKFTIQEEPDTEKPTITVVTADLKLTKGTVRKVDLTVTDNKALPTNKTKIYYRGISKIATEPFATATFSVVSGGGTVSTSFTLDAQENWYDEMGLELYFEAEDASGNIQRAPATAGTYLYSYIDYQSSAPALPSSRISIGGKANNYRIISVPFDLQDNQIPTVLNELGATDISLWRMFTYAGDNKFTENPQTFARGTGYWINVKNNPGEIKIEGASTPANNRTSFYSMNLNPGWNQIGNPYPVSISWNDTRVGNESTIGKVKVFDGASYSDGNVLEAYQGGFVFVQGAAPISVKVRFNGITTGGRIATEETSLDLSKPNWALPLTVKSNEIANSIGGIGMNEKAKMGWDQYDDRNPPRFLDYAELSFRKTNTDVTDLARDIISTQDEYIWEFSVLAEGNTNLTWAHELISGDKDLLLFDLTSQRVIDMKATGTYLLNPKEGNNFRIYFGNNLHDLIKPTAIVLGKAFPNPAQNETNIAFTLPESQSTYQVQLEVYNSVGQREAILANGTFYEGFYSTNWNTENNNNGLYFYRLTVSTNGIKKTLTEKIIINR